MTRVPFLPLSTDIFHSGDQTEQPDWLTRAEMYDVNPRRGWSRAPRNRVPGQPLMRCPMPGGPARVNEQLMLTTSGLQPLMKMLDHRRREVMGAFLRYRTETTLGVTDREALSQPAPDSDLAYSDWHANKYSFIR